MGVYNRIVIRHNSSMIYRYRAKLEYLTTSSSSNEANMHCADSPHHVREENGCPGLVIELSAQARRSGVA
jgi:hypothetical protein